MYHVNWIKVADFGIGNGFGLIWAHLVLYYMYHQCTNTWQPSFELQYVMHEFVSMGPIR
jgi:hypothetical protein